MRMRTFTAADMPGAMQKVRESLGDDAIIISSSSDKLRRRVTVTAAIEEDAYAPIPRAAFPGASPQPAAPGKAEWQEDIASLLRYHGVPEALAGTIVYKARSLEPSSLRALQKMNAAPARVLEEQALTRLLSACFSFAPLDLIRNARLMLVGPPGIGKTLAVAKLATAGHMEGASLTVITTDTKRAGGVEQLAAFTDILGVDLRIAGSAKELARMLEEIPTGDRVFIDTAGCNPYEREEMRELGELIGIGGFEPLLVLPAGMDAYEAADAARAFSFPSIRRLLATRADTARRFGSLLAASATANLAFSHISGSGRVVGELTPLTPLALAQCLLRYRLHDS